MEHNDRQNSNKVSDPQQNCRQVVTLLGCYAYLETLFPSSIGGMLFPIEGGGVTPFQGEMYKHIGFFSKMYFDNELPERETIIFFSRGLECKDLCGYEMHFCVREDDVIVEVSEHRCTVATRFRKEIECSVYRPGFPTEEKFLLSRDLLEEFIDKTKGKIGLPLPNKHPLLNPNGTRRIELDFPSGSR